MIPEHLKYAPTHEWFHVETKSITVGLTKHIIDELINFCSWTYLK